MNPLRHHATLGGDDAQVAVIASDGTRTTYGELRGAVTTLSKQLVDAGVRTDSLVAVGGSVSVLRLIGCLAAWDAGGAVMPVDARLPRPVTDALLARARPTVVLRDGAIERGVEPRQVDDRTGLLLFTSGSSGPAKGVLLSAVGIAANVEAILSYLPVRATPHTAMVLPLVYSYALVGQALTTLRTGGTLVLLDDVGFAAQQIEKMAALNVPLGLSSVPTSLRLLARAAIDAKASLTLGYVASAGGKLDGATLELVRRAFPGVLVFNQYGLTEASPRVTAIGDTQPAFALGTVGKPLPGLQVFAIDAGGRRLPSGATGELAVRGPSVMLGYLDDAPATERALAGDGTLRTGDLGHVDVTGHVFIEGRRDRQVKVAGERVGLEQVSEILRQALECEAEVIAIDDVTLGARLVAFVVGGDELLPKVREVMRARLTAAQRPARVVPVTQLPRTANGKVDLQALVAQAEHA